MAGAGAARAVPSGARECMYIGSRGACGGDGASATPRHDGGARWWRRALQANRPFETLSSDTWPRVPPLAMRLYIDRAPLACVFLLSSSGCFPNKLPFMLRHGASLSLSEPRSMRPCLHRSPGACFVRLSWPAPPGASCMENQQFSPASQRLAAMCAPCVRQSRAAEPPRLPCLLASLLSLDSSIQRVSVLDTDGSVVDDHGQVLARGAWPLV